MGAILFQPWCVKITLNLVALVSGNATIDSQTQVDSFTVSLYSLNGRQLPAVRLYKGTVSGLRKLVEISRIHYSLRLRHSPNYI